MFSISTHKPSRWIRTLVCLAMLTVPSVGAAEPVSLESPKPTLLALIQYLEDHRTGLKALQKLAQHPDPDVRGFALLALGRNENSKARPTLENGLSDAVANVRRMAAFALGQLGSHDATGSLIKRLKTEKNPDVTREIWRALSRIGRPGDLGEISRFHNHDPQASVESMGLVFARAKRPISKEPWLIRSLASADPKRMAAGFYALYRNRSDTINKEVVRQAMHALEGDDLGVHEAASSLLSRSVEPFLRAAGRLIRSSKLPGHQRAAIARGALKSKSGKANHVWVKALGKVCARLKADKAWLTDAIHPALTLADGLIGRPLSDNARGILKWILKKPLHEKVYLKLPEASQRRIKRLRCSVKAILGRLDECPVVLQMKWGKALKKPASFFEQKLKDTQASVRMNALMGLSGAALERALPHALADADGPVVASAAGMALKHNIASEPVAKALLEAWARLYKKKDAEVLVDLMRAIDGLKLKGTQEVLYQGGSMVNRAIRAEATQRLIKRKLKPPAPLPDPGIPSRQTFSQWRKGLGKVPTAVTITTDIGPFTWRFFRHLAPRTSEQIGALLKKGYYKNLLFHRVVPHFVVQGGDPRGDGWGGPGRTMRCENNPVPYDIGVVGMALAGKDTGGSQFFVTLARQPHLLGTYTAFGRITSGMNVVRALIVGDRILGVALTWP